MWKVTNLWGPGGMRLKEESSPSTCALLCLPTKRPEEAVMELGSRLVIARIGWSLPGTGIVGDGEQWGYSLRWGRGSKTDCVLTQGQCRGTDLCGGSWWTYFSKSCHVGSTNQNYHEMPLHTHCRAVIEKNRKQKCWQGCREKRTLVQCWWACKLVRPLWQCGSFSEN